MKPLKPSLREKKRYLSVNGKIDDIQKAILDFIGVLGMSKTGFNWIKKGENYAIISINREMVNKVRASFCVWPEKISVERVSGTLKGLKK